MNDEQKNQIAEEAWKDILDFIVGRITKDETQVIHPLHIIAAAIEKANHALLNDLGVPNVETGGRLLELAERIALVCESRAAHGIRATTEGEEHYYVPPTHAEKRPKRKPCYDPLCEKHRNQCSCELVDGDDKNCPVHGAANASEPEFIQCPSCGWHPVRKHEPHASEKP